MPDLPERLAHWLFYGPARLPSGAYLSWFSDDLSGFIYAEAATHVVRAASWWHRETGREDPLRRMIATLRFLESSVEEDGLLWHMGTGYLFDTLLLRRAFAEAESAGVEGSFSRLIPRMDQKSLDMVKNRKATASAREKRWSTLFGPHLLKVLADMWGVRLNCRPEHAESIQSAVRSLLLQQEPDGSFPSPENGPVYLHAHCYALEGLALLREYGMKGADRMFHRGLRFLASLQRENGSFPRWDDDSHREEEACDVAAQAGRLFLVDGKDRWERNIRGVSNALARYNGNSGGLIYMPGLRHENVCCTVFALQFFHGLKSGKLTAEEII